MQFFEYRERVIIIHHNAGISTWSEKQPSEVFCKSSHRRCSLLLKKRLWHKCFPLGFVKFLGTPFLQNTSGRLPLFEWCISNQRYQYYNEHYFQGRYGGLVLKTQCYNIHIRYSQKFFSVLFCNFQWQSSDTTVSSNW